MTSETIDARRIQDTFTVVLFLKNRDAIVIEQSADYATVNDIVTNIKRSINEKKVFLDIRTGVANTTSEADYTVLVNEVSHVRTQKN